MSRYAGKINVDHFLFSKLLFMATNLNESEHYRKTST